MSLRRFPPEAVTAFAGAVAALVLALHCIKSKYAELPLRRGDLEPFQQRTVPDVPLDVQQALAEAEPQMMAVEALAGVEPQMVAVEEEEVDNEKMQAEERQRFEQEKCRRAGERETAQRLGAVEDDNPEREREVLLAGMVADMLEMMLEAGEKETEGAAPANTEGGVETVIQTTAVSLLEKLQSRKVQKLLQNDTHQLDKLNLNAFEILVVTRCLKERNSRPAEFITLASNRSMGLAGVDHLSRWLVCSQGPKSLLIGDNDLGDAGIQLIASALAKDPRLDLLDVRNNRLTETSGQLLADALRTNSNLTSLYLNNDSWCVDERRNAIGLVGAKFLVQAIASRASPLKLALSGNGVSAEAHPELKRLAGKSRILF